MGECRLGEGPALWLITLTVAAYLAFTIAYGEEVFDPDIGDCSGLTSCANAIFSMIGGFFQLVTLGGFTSPLPVLIQGPLLVFFAFSWGPIIYDAIIGALQAIAEAIPF